MVSLSPAHDGGRVAARPGLLLTTLLAVCLSGPSLCGSPSPELATPLPNNSYDEKDARMLASLSSLAYCDNASRVLDWSAAPCRDSGTRLTAGKIRVIDGDLKRSARSIVGKFNDRSGCLVSFRGTHYIENWIRELEAWLQPPVGDFRNCEGCLVEAGMYEIWNNLEGPVLQALRDVGCRPGSDDAALHVTGHSLGGALAQFAALALGSFGYATAKLYTFESPRVGNRAFSAAIRSQLAATSTSSFRITHNKDPIPHLPLELMGYVHSQTEVFYDSMGKATVCQHHEDQACADQFKNLPDLVLFHSMDHCATPLTPSGDLCNPRGCSSEGGDAVEGLLI